MNLSLKPLPINIETEKPEETIPFITDEDSITHFGTVNKNIMPEAPATLVEFLKQTTTVKKTILERSTISHMDIPPITTHQQSSQTSLRNRPTCVVVGYPVALQFPNNFEIDNDVNFDYEALFNTL